MTIVICCSANFYRQANQIAVELRSSGYEVVVPLTAEKMEQNNDYEVSHYKTWFENDGDYQKKADLMRGHFDKVEAGDAILVVNYEKRGQPDYIGGNVLMEMALAFYLKKPIYVLNSIPEKSSFLEEIIGLGSIPLRGKLKDLPRL